MFVCLRFMLLSYLTHLQWNICDVVVTLFTEEPSGWPAVTVPSVGRRVLGVIVVVISAWQDRADASRSNWKLKEKIENFTTFLCGVFLEISFEIRSKPLKNSWAVIILLNTGFCIFVSL